MTSFGLVLARHAWLCRALAASTIVCEAGYPLALVAHADRHARAFLVPGALLMQIGIRVFLGPTFPQMMICNAFWVPWGRRVRLGRPG